MMTSLESAQKNYEANLKSIPWDSAIAKNFRDSNTSTNSTINANLPIFVNLVEQAARKVSGAEAQRSRARNATDMAMNNLKNIPNSIDTRIAQIDVGGIQNKIRAVEDQIAAETSKQRKSDELLELRKEQTAVLEKKYGANLHSSWLGLWRPLKETSHVALNVASAMFGVLALLTIGYLAYFNIALPKYSSSAGAGANVGGEGIANSINSLGNLFQAGAKNLMSNLNGGFRKVRR